MGSIAADEEMPAFFPDVRDKAIIYHADECAEKSAELFEQMGLPGGLLPLTDIVEGAWVEETGFTWTVTRHAQQHHFLKADRHCKYDELVTATISVGKMTNIHGVKVKELGLWVPINEISVDPKDPSKIIFKSIMGLSRSMDADLFKRAV